MIIDDRFTSIDPNARVIVCEENHMKYVAYNTKGAVVYKFKIDGEVIANSAQKKCDYLVENETAKDAYFVELKGADISTAFKQLLETLCLFATETKGYSIHSRVVCSKVVTHNLYGTEYRSLKKKCRDVQFKTRKFEEEI